jgi:hypothetical protein
VQQNPCNGTFTGPDGHEWVYAFLPDINAVVVARQDLSPTEFDLMVFYNEDTLCTPESSARIFLDAGCVPECGCEPGDAAIAD